MPENREVLEAIQDMRGDIAKIREALLGNPYREGDKGISGEVLEHGKRIAKMEQKYSASKAFLAGIVATCTVAGSLIGYFIDHLFHKN